MSQVDDVCKKNPHIRKGIIDNKFRVEALIGGGGMACVYKVRALDDPHPYALKLLQPQFVQNQVYWSLFEEEGRRLSKLNHPNIVRFYEFALRDNFAYILMDYIEGISLSDLLARFRQEQKELPLSEVIRISVQTTRALRYLHQQNIIHRDIKPANILIQRRTGKVFLSDFGIATDQGSVEVIKGGTSGYMPPEQQETTGVPVTYKADLYALGVVTFEMLVGSRPFRAKSNLKGTDARHDLILKHAQAPIPSIVAQKPHLPRELDGVIEKALAKHPDQRYEDAKAFMVDLHRACLPLLPPDLHNLDEIQALDPYTTTDIQANTPSRRFPLAWVALLMVGVVIAVGAIIIGLNGGTGSEAQVATPTPTIEPSPIPSDTQVIVSPDAITEVAENSTGEILTPQAINTDTELPPSPSATQTDIPTTTPTFTPSATITPSPTPFLQEVGYLSFLQNASALNLGDNLEGAVEIAMAEFEDIIPLNVGALNGFRVEIQLGSLDHINEYGVVYRLQDNANYLRFVIVPTDHTWRVEQVSNDLPNLLDQGTLPADEDLTRLMVMGEDNLFRLEVGAMILQNVSDVYPEGRMGLWFRMDDPALSPEITFLDVAAVGDKANELLESSPTPAQVVNFELLLLEDLTQLLETGTAVNLSINCTSYLQLYEALERHLERGGEVADIAQRAIGAGASVHSRCEGNLSSTDLSFVGSPRDYTDWDTEMRSLIDELTALQ